MKAPSFADSDRARQIIAEHPEWYHSIELAPGIVTPGRAPLEVWNATLRYLDLPDLHGKAVLDIGAYDGFFSFAAERLGAARVVALDEHVWATDMTAYLAEWRAAKQTGSMLPAPRDSRHWRPQELPGRRPFDAARDLFESAVEPVVGNFMTMDFESLGRFDVVLFLGILYHMEDPLAALHRVARLLKPGGLLAIETEAVDIPAAPDRALFEFFPANELNNDVANWWAPNAKGLEGLTTAVGLVDFELRKGPPHVSPVKRLSYRFGREIVRYRAIARSRKP